MSQLDIRLLGPISELSSVSQNMRELSLALADIGININIANFDLSPFKAKLNPETVARINLLMQNKISENYITIHFLPPERLIINDNGAKVNIAWSGYETPETPKLCSLLLNNPRFNDIFVPSIYNKNGLKDSGIMENKIKVINWGVDSMGYTPQGNKMNVENEDDFYFGFVGNIKISNGVDLLIKAFYEEFKDEPKAKLIFKPIIYVQDETQKPAIVEKLFRPLKGNSKAEIFVIVDNQTENSMKEIYRRMDVFVAPYRLKTFGTSLIHAMSCGVPAIVNANTFNRTYTTSENSLNVSSTKKSIDNIEWIINNTMQQDCSWYEPNFIELKSKMRYAFEHKQEMKKLGEKAREDVLKFDWRNIAMNLISNLKKYSL